MQSLLMDGKTRSQLRRSDPFEVPGVYAWVKKVKQSQGLTAIEDERIIAVAAPIAALVRTECADTLGVRLQVAGVKARHVSRLLASDRDDLSSQMDKVVRLVNRQINIEDLVSNIIYWGPSVRRRIAIDYYSHKNDDSHTEPEALKAGDAISDAPTDLSAST